VPTKTTALSPVVALFCLCLSVHSATASEVYILGDQQVLLYKIINWWYFAPDDYSGQLCGESISYKSSGTAEIHLSPDSSTMKLSFNQQCAPLLALVGDGNTSPTKTSMDSSWVNEDYFTSHKATLTIEETPHTNSCSIAINNVQYEQQDYLLAHQSILTLNITGTLYGLGEGKMALSPAGDFLEKCRATRNESTPPEAPVLTVALTEQGPPLLKFTLSSN
jgi:hypothetical protein